MLAKDYAECDNYRSNLLLSQFKVTTLISWIGVDSRGQSSIYLASDSRISWGKSSSWDNGRKLFVSKNRPDIFGYCGDVLFPTQVLGQIVEQIDQFILFNRGETFGARAAIVLTALEIALNATPIGQQRAFEVIYASRELEGMQSHFQVCRIGWNQSEKWTLVDLELSKHSGLIKGIGTGAAANAKWYDYWQRSDVARTSRSVFGAFCDSLRNGEDPLSGGPPQLVGIYRSGPARSFGVIAGGKRYLNGQVVNSSGTFDHIEWRNELFERCDGNTMKLLSGAQPQPKPKGRPEGKY